MKNNPIAFDELGNQIAKLDGLPLPTTNNLEGWENKILSIADYLGCNDKELLNEMRILRQVDCKELRKYVNQFDISDNVEQLIEDYYENN